MHPSQLSSGLIHELPDDMRVAISTNLQAASAWEDISVKARNEWICWTITVKQTKTRLDHVDRTVKELANGVRRPCCWVGCIHRTDKPVGAWARKVLIDKQPKI